MLHIKIRLLFINEIKRYWRFISVLYSEVHISTGTINKIIFIVFSVTAEYETISKRVLTPPTDTAGLLELTKFVKRSSEITLKTLENKLLDVIEHIMMLSDYWLLTEIEISTNNVAFQWYHKMSQIYEENRLIIENKTQEFQDVLKG